MLARALKDRSQAALRAALGAGRARLVWKALCESLAVALLGAVVGIAVAHGSASLLLRLAFAPDAWVPVSAAPSTPALLFALGVSVVTAVLCGIAPAWMASRAAYGVEQRTREIGVRTALGADSRSVVVMVLRGTLTQLAIGLGLGIPAAIAIGHWVASQVFRVSPWDPTMLAGAALVLGLAASIAAAPARRAARVDPLVALRSE